MKSWKSFVDYGHSTEEEEEEEEVEFSCMQMSLHRWRHHNHLNKL